MKDRFDRAKDFARKHRMLVAYGVGVGVGATTMYKFMSKQDLSVYLTANPDNLQMLIDKPDGALRWQTTRGVITVLNELHSQL